MQQLQCMRRLVPPLLWCACSGCKACLRTCYRGQKHEQKGERFEALITTEPKRTYNTRLTSQKSVPTETFLD